MRTKHLLIGATALGLLLAACGSDDKASDTTKAAATTAAAGASTTAAAATPGGTVDCKPIKPGVLTVVTSLPGPNFWGTNESDPTQIKTGLEYDMAPDIAARCGLKMEFRNEGFDAIVAGQIPDGSYDIVLSQVTITDDRAKVVDFSTGYFKADQGILVKKGTTVGSWDDLKKMTVGVQASTTAESYLMGQTGDGKYKIDNIKSFPDLTSTYEALSSGQVGRGGHRHADQPRPGRPVQRRARRSSGSSRPVTSTGRSSPRARTARRSSTRSSRPCSTTARSPT